MFYPNCGTRNEEGTSYRVDCGAELRKLQTPNVEVPPPEVGGAGLSAGSATGPGTSVPNTPNYLVQAVLLSLVCLILSFVPIFVTFLGVVTGIVAIVYGAQVNGKVAGGNHVGARDSSRLARVWTWITFAVLIVEVLVLAAFFLLPILVLVAGAAAWPHCARGTRDAARWGDERNRCRFAGVLKGIYWREWEAGLGREGRRDRQATRHHGRCSGRCPVDRARFAVHSGIAFPKGEVRRCGVE